MWVGIMPELPEGNWGLTLTLHSPFLKGHISMEHSLSWLIQKLIMPTTVQAGKVPAKPSPKWLQGSDFLPSVQE